VRGCSLVEVNDSLEITSHTLVPLDVVRWAHLKLDLSKVTDEEALTSLITTIFSEALHEVGERLLAVRLSLTGATSLHGFLHANLSRWQAECTSIASDIDPECLWFERLKIKTTPTYDPQELAKRDEKSPLRSSLSRQSCPPPFLSKILKLLKKMSRRLCCTASLPLNKDALRFSFHSCFWTL